MNGHRFTPHYALMLCVSYRARLKMETNTRDSLMRRVYSFCRPAMNVMLQAALRSVIMTRIEPILPLCDPSTTSLFRSMKHDISTHCAIVTPPQSSALYNLPQQ